jgi:hypothetical protein
VVWVRSLKEILCDGYINLYYSLKVVSGVEEVDLVVRKAVVKSCKP